MNARSSAVSSAFLPAVSVTGTVGERSRAAQVTGDVAYAGEVAVERIGDVDAHAAVEVVADLQHGRCAVGEPVRGDRQVVVGRIARVEAADELAGGQA